MAREQSERAKQALEDYEALARRKDELDLRVASLEQECEELLDKGILDGSSDFKVGLFHLYSKERILLTFICTRRPS